MYSIKSKDKLIINNELHNIKKNVKLINNNNIISKTTYDIVKNIILQYTKTHNKIIYGGFALNTIMKHKTNESIYNKHDIPDIEFYSDCPWKDAKSICDILYNIGFNTEAKEAIHSNTLSIFVNRFNCCDITFYNKKILEVFKTLSIDGNIYIHPHHMYTDYLNILNIIDQYAFYDKTIPKIAWIVEHYPFEDRKISTRINNINLLKTPWIYKMIQKKSLILTDSYAVHEYTKHSGIKDHMVSQQLTLLSCNLHEDAVYVYNIIMKNNKETKVVEYYKFSEYIGRKVTFHTDSNVVITLIDSMREAVACIEKNGIQILNIQSLHRYLLLKILYFDVLLNNSNKDNNAQKLKIKQISEYDEQALRNAWNRFYLKNDIIIAKNELFSIFVNNYVGLHQSNFIKNQIDFELRILKKHKNFPIKPKYNPIVSKELPNTYIMQNCLGQQIFNQQDKIVSWL